MTRVTPAVRPLLRLLHIWWPLALGWSVAVVVRRATGRPWDPVGVALLLLGIAAAYSLDRALDPPSEQPRWMRPVLMGAAAVASLLGGALLPWLGPQAAMVVPLAGALAVAYPLLKRLPLGKTVLVPLVWTWCGIVLPSGEGPWSGWRWIQEPVALPLFLLFAAGCVLCDLKDAARDREAGVPSLPVLAGPLAALGIAVALAALSGAIAAAQGRHGLALGAVALCASACRPALLATDDVGPLLVDVILTLPGALIAARLV